MFIRICWIIEVLYFDEKIELVRISVGYKIRGEWIF